MSKKQKKILVISSPPKWGGGILTMIEQFGLLLEQLEFQPVFLYLDTEEKNNNLSFTLQKVKVLRWNGYKVKPLPFVDWNRLTLIQYIWFFLLSRKVIKKFDYFAYVGATSHFSYPLHKARKSYVSWLATSYEDELESKCNSEVGDAPAKNLLNSWQWKYLVRIEEDSLKSARVNFALSEYTADKLKMISSHARIDIMPTFIDTNLFYKKGKISSIVSQLIYAGRINDPRKNIAGLVKAVKLLNQSKLHRYKLVLVSEKPSPDLNRLIKENLYNQDFLHVNFLPHHKLPQLLRKADLFILPSYQEGLGISALEAMSCGVPVIAAPTGGLDKILNDSRAGMISRSFSAKSLAKAIETLTGDMNLYSNMSLAGSEYVRNNLSFEKILHIFKKGFSEPQDNCKFKALILDFDGTLIDNYPPKISNNLINLLEQIQNKIIVIIATGRDEEFIKPYLKRLNLDGLHVLGAGSIIINMSNERYFDVKFIDDKAIRGLTPIIRDYNGQIVSSDGTYDGRLNQIDNKKKITKISLYSLEPDKSLGLIKILKRYKVGLSRSTAAVGRVNLDITARDSSKKSAIDEVLKYYKIGWNQVIAFGDSYNDLDILRAAKFSMARETAPDLVKASVNYITNKNGALDGLKHIISKL